MTDSIFFHPLTWDNDMYLVYGAWALILFLSFWLVRFIHKLARRSNMKYKGGSYYLCRDIFMRLNGFEYLLVLCVLFACYMGYWAYKVSPSRADWGLWQTYMVVLPQIVLLILMIVLFFWRYTNFRKPYIK